MSLLLGRPRLSLRRNIKGISVKVCLQSNQWLFGFKMSIVSTTSRSLWASRLVIRALDAYKHRLLSLARISCAISQRWLRSSICNAGGLCGTFYTSVIIVQHVLFARYSGSRSPWSWEQMWNTGTWHPSLIIYSKKNFALNAALFLLKLGRKIAFRSLRDSV